MCSVCVCVNTRTYLNTYLVTFHHCKFVTLLLPKENTRADIEDVRRIFTLLQHVVKIHESGLVNVLALLHRKAENRSESIKENLEEEISELEDRKYELEQLSQTGDDLRLLQVFDSSSSFSQNRIIANLFAIPVWQ